MMTDTTTKFLLIVLVVAKDFFVIQTEWTLVQIVY